jgi:hypothetical protein
MAQRSDLIRCNADPRKAVMRRLRRRRAARLWRAVVAWGTLSAFLWPSVSALPWLWVAPTVALVAEHTHDDESGGLHLHPHGENFAPPGSPAHPLDHDCPQCLALAHLMRCALPAPNPPSIAGSPAPAVDVYVAATPRPTCAFGAPPPIRSPPPAVT